MDAREPHLPEDDEPVPMTADERTVWVYLVTVVATSGTYFAVMLLRLLTQPVEQISWVGPMLWTIGLSVLGTVIGTVVATVVGRVRTAAAVGVGVGVSGTETGAGSPACTPGGGPGEVGSDVRDREIDRLGGGAQTGVIGVGLGAALVLAMIDAHPFWIGNAVFLCGTIGAVVETTTKIRLYRRGF